MNIRKEWRSGKYEEVVIFANEAEALKAMLAAGKAYGYDKMIAHLQMAWARHLMETCGLDEVAARATKKAVASRVTKEKLAGVEWRHQYGSYWITLDGWLDMSLHWHDGAYCATVAGRNVVQRAETAEEAAAIAVSTARTLAQGIVKLLEGAK